MLESVCMLFIYLKVASNISAPNDPIIHFSQLLENVWIITVFHQNFPGTIMAASLAQSSFSVLLFFVYNMVSYTRMTPVYLSQMLAMQQYDWAT